MASSSATPGYDVICFSLEPWDDVWRRNQFFTAELLAQRPSLRLLFVEPPIDVLWSLANKHVPTRRPLRRIGETGRLWGMAPQKWLPRRLSKGVDRSLAQQVRAAAASLGMRNTVLWINDCNYARFAAESSYPIVYDITDDWLLASDSRRNLDRLRANDDLLRREADEVVVCSPSLSLSKGSERDVHLITNGVDVDHFRRPRPRPRDLPRERIALYAGTLAEERLDVELCIALCHTLAGRATLVLVGPNALSPHSTQVLERAGALLLGSRPYADIPGYMQHSDVLVIPHVITPFTESLDPIKAREILAVGRPTVSTPVAGFRELGSPVTAVDRDRFPAVALATLEQHRMHPGPGPLLSSLPSWSSKATRFLEVLDGAASHLEAHHQ